MLHGAKKLCSPHDGESYFVPWVSAAPADVMNVHVERYASGRYSFVVTVNHPDEGVGSLCRWLFVPMWTNNPLEVATVRVKCSKDGFVRYYNHERYHESLNNLTPADVFYCRDTEILNQRGILNKTRWLCVSNYITINNTTQ